MYKNHGKHDPHYLIYKYTRFSCNPSCRWCLNHSITDSHSQVQRGGILHQDRGPSGAPPPVILSLNNLMPLGCSPCLIRRGIEALVYVSCWSQWQPPPPHPNSLKTLSRICMQSWFCGFLQRTMTSCSKDLHEINASTDFQWSMRDLGCLVNVINFELLCRKLSFFT